MTWDELSEQYLALKSWDRQAHNLNPIWAQARQLIAESRQLAIAWLTDALADDRRKWFAAVAIKQFGGLPKALLAPTVRAAVYEINPSLNRTFVELATRTYGVHEILNRLLNYVENGTDFEKAGAANATYWAAVPIRYVPDAPSLELEYAILESRAALAALGDVDARARELFLREFVRNPNVDVRRSIVCRLELDRSQYDLSLHPLIKQAIHIARTHTDEYIRHRIEIQLGAGGGLMALPHREAPSQSQAD